MNSRVIIRFCSLVLAMLVLCWTSALADYYPRMHATQEQRISSSEFHTDAETDAQLRSILAAMDIYIEGYLQLDQAWNMHLSPYRGKTPDLNGINISRLTIAPTTAGSFRTAYAVNGQQLYLGMGRSFDRFNDWTTDYQVYTFLMQAGSVQIVDTFELLYEYSAGIFAVDLDHDGSLELICSSTSGVSYSGMLELLTVQPDGTFALFGGSEETSRLASSYAKCELQDFDQDGYWELEIYRPFPYCGTGAGFLLALLAYNPGGQRFNDILGNFPGQYPEYMDFYTHFVHHLEAYRVNPGQYPATASHPGGPACEIAEKWYRLGDCTAAETAALLRYIESWDTGILQAAD